MAHPPLNVQMLGEFSLSIGDRSICDNDNRSRKVWLLLAYMIYYRRRSISKEELIDHFWADSDGSADPANALKAVFHRARTMLDQLMPNGGKELILCQQGEYRWNPDWEVVLDIDQFERLLRQFRREQDDTLRLDCGVSAAALFRGDFLSRLSGEPWVFSLTAYFHRTYLELVQDCLGLLAEAGRGDDIINLSRQAIQVEPCDEVLYYHLMRALLDAGDVQGVRGLYESMSSALFSRLGIMPSDELRALYREASSSISSIETDLTSILEDLREVSEVPGAFLCDYDFFKALYQVEARSIARSGDAVHICLLSVTGAKNKSLSQRSLDLCMDNLSNIIVRSLRSGDIAARCSPSQFVIMLPRADYENSCRIMDRIIRAFYRQFPHSPAELRQMVQPLVPSDL